MIDREQMDGWGDVPERLRRLSPSLDMLSCEDVLTAADIIEALEAENARYREALQRIDDWSRAYPITAFPEPDFKAAAVVLKENGMTLDAISASNMRHVTKGVGEIARTALTPPQRHSNALDGASGTPPTDRP